MIVVEEASVHETRLALRAVAARGGRAAGLAARSRTACHDEGALVLAALGHSGGQGSSAYSQLPLWAPSRVPEVNSREVPKAMEPADIARRGRRLRARPRRLAVAAGSTASRSTPASTASCASSSRASPTNATTSGAQDRLAFAREVLVATRRAAGDDAIVGLRLSCDELAPWAGIVPEAAAQLAVELVAAGAVDYVTVVRGSIFSVAATRPDGHTPPGFNLDLARSIRAALDDSVAVIAQGSIVDVGQAEWAIGDGACDAVEMTRAQIADPDLARKLAAGDAFADPAVHPVQPDVHGARRAQPDRELRRRARRRGTSGRTSRSTVTPTNRADVLVVGGGVAGLELARVAAEPRPCGDGRGRDPTSSAARSASPLGARAANGLALIADWLEAECTRLGVTFERGREVGPPTMSTPFDGDVVLCTGRGRAGGPTRSTAMPRSAPPPRCSPAPPCPTGAVAVWDPIGGPIGISVAERAAQRRAARCISSRPT